MIDAMKTIWREEGMLNFIKCSKTMFTVDGIVFARRCVRLHAWNEASNALSRHFRCNSVVDLRIRKTTVEI